jgi:serine/threonine protein kinase/tetratricopeptide (TPR) repeat protein
LAEENASTATHPSQNTLATTEVRSAVNNALSEPDQAVKPSGMFGDYELLHELGHGGMGVVYKAIQKKLNRVVALKMLLGGARAKASTVARFRAEAIAVAKLDHPNITQIYDIGEIDDLPFFSMEFVDGGTLDQKLDRKPQEARVAARMILPVVRAMAYAHSRGIIHRDIKPANILLTRDGTPKVTDFGLAKQFEAADGDGDVGTRSGAIMGTPNYMAPEQADGNTKQADHRADIYSLGATLYELLTGRPPFNGPSVPSILVQVRETDPIAPCLLQPTIAKDIQTITLKCLQKDPLKRYQSAASMAEDLERYLDGRTIMARPVSTAERFFRWCKRKRALAAAVLFAGCMAVCLISLSIVYNVVLAKKNHEISTQRDMLDGANQNLVSANVRITTERDAAQRTGDSAYLLVKQLRRYIGDELKRNGMLRQRAELSELIEQSMTAIERVTSSGAAGLERNRVSYLMDRADQYSDPSSLLPGAQQERFSKALVFVNEAFQLYEPIATHPDAGDLPRANYANMLLRRGAIKCMLNQTEAGEADFLSALKLCQDIVDQPRNSVPDPDAIYPANALRSLARTHFELVAYPTSTRADEAKRLFHFGEALRLNREALDLVQRNPQATDDVGGVLGFKRATAEMLAGAGVLAYIAGLQTDPNTKNAIVIKPEAMEQVFKHFSDAEELYPQVLRTFDGIERFFPNSDAPNTLILVRVLYREGLNAFKKQDSTNADKAWHWADAMVSRAAPRADGADALVWDNEQARLLYALGALARTKPDLKKAQLLFQECVALRRRLLAADSTNPTKVWPLIVALARLGNTAEAIKLLDLEIEAQKLPERASIANNFWYQAVCTYSLCAEGLGGFKDDGTAKPDEELTEELVKLRRSYLDKADAAAKLLEETQARNRSGLNTDPDAAYWCSRSAKE